MSEELDGGILSRLLMGCLLYRLGGQQTFTPAEIDEIKDMVGGVQIFVTHDDKIVARVKGPEATQKAMDEGNVI